MIRCLSKKKIFLPIIVALIISIPVNFIISYLLGWDTSLLDRPDILARNLSSDWIIVLVLFLIIYFWEKKNLRSIGIKSMEKIDFFYGFIILFIQLALLFFTDFFVNLLGLTSQSAETSRVLLLPIYLQLFIVITAGITEEIIFRGYLIERLNLLSKNLIISGIISYILFVIFHIPFWGLGGAIQIAFWTIPITIYYIKRRNLTTCILVHLAYDATIFVPMVLNYFELF